MAVCGAAAIFGWHFDLPVAKSLMPGLATMKYNTALCFVLSGIALWCLRDETTRGLERRIGGSCALLVLTISILTLGEYAFGWNWGIDEILMRDGDAASKAAGPGRMSAATAICFGLFGLATLWMDFCPGRGHRPAQSLALLGMLCALVALEGYVFGIQALYRFFIFSSVALHTAVLFLVLGFGVLCARAEHGLVSVVVSTRAGGRVARKALPWAIALPIVIALLCLHGERAGYCDMEVGLAISTISSILIFVSLIWIAARSLNQFHAELEERGVANAQFAALVASSVDAIIGKDLNGIVTSWNPGAEKVFGYSASEMIGQPLRRLIPPERQSEEGEILARVRRGERVEHFETVRLRKDGQQIHVSVSVSPIKDATGVITGASKVARDMSDRHRAERRLEESFREISKLKAALDEHAIVAITDPSGKITYVNDKFCAISKFSRAELIGQDHRVINSGHHPKEFIRELWAAIGQGRVWKGEIKNQAKDGTCYWVDTTLVPFLKDDGKPYQYVAIRTDITARKELVESLRHSQQRVRLATDGTQVGIWEWNIKTNQVKWDARMFQIYGIEPTADHLVSYSTWRDAVHPEDLSRQEEILQATAFNGGQSRRTFRIRRRNDGDERYIEAVEVADTGPDGQILWVVGTNLDITARARAERERENLLAKLEEKHAEIERFLYLVSHDLKSPLITIKSFAGMVGADLAAGHPDRAAEDLGRIECAANRMNSLLEELLRFSRLGAVPNVPEAVSMTELAEGAKDIVAGRLMNRGITVEIQPDLPVVLGDRTRLFEVVQNLLDNAAKFMGDQAAPRIEVGARQNGGVPEFYIRDNGIGLDSRYYSKIFGLFDKLDPKAEGSGVGLSLVKRVIEKHGGKIWVESEGVGRGTTFWFTLPTHETHGGKQP